MRNDNQFVRKFEPFGKLSYALTGYEPAIDIFRILWKHSTEFCMVNSHVGAIQTDSAKHKIATICRSFDGYGYLKKSATEAVWVQQWPGTTTMKPDRLLVIGNTKKAEFASIFPKSTRIFWRGGNEWDDLILMDKAHILFYVCSHEGFGEIFGDERLFKNLNLSAQPSKKERVWEINGVRVEPELVNKFIGE